VCFGIGQRRRGLRALVGAGHVYTVDDGRDWAAVLAENTGIFTPEETHSDFADYLRYLRERFGLTQQLTHISTSLPPFPVMDQPIDLLFSDYMHGPNDILQILGTYLSSMATSTSFPSYALL
jgi:hypothetical protein